MAYDVEGARKAGLSDAEINNYLASKYKYNLAGAREAGVPDAEILTHLLAKDKPKATPTTAPTTEVAPILSPEEQVTSQAGVTVPVTPTVAAQPKPPSDLAMGSEFGKGTKAGFIGLKSTATGVNLLKEANFVGSAIQNLDVYKQIDEGKITSLADAEGLGLPKDQVRMYLAAKSPEAREQMKQNQQSIIDKRQGFIREGLGLFKQYQAEAEKVKGVTPDATDIGTVKDFGNWLAFNVGSGAVQLAPIILAALTTGGPGAFALGTTMGVGETVSNRLEFIQNKVKDLPPEQQANEIEKYIRDTSNTTMAIGLASGALDLAGPVGSILRGRAGKEGVKYLTKKEGLKAGIKEAPRAITEEGLTGGAQEAVQIGGKRVLGEQTGDVLSEENIKAVLNAAAAEAAGGLGGTTVTTGLKVAQGQAAQNQAKEAKAIEDQKKILDKLNAPGALENLGQQFNETVEKLKGAINPDTNQPYTEQEAYAIAGDAILQGGLLDGTESTIGGTDQSSVSVPGKPSETDTGVTDTTRGDLATAGTTTDVTGGGEGTELNTLAASLKAKYNLTDEQATAAATESLRQKQIAAQQQATGTGAPTPTSALTAEQEQRRTELKSILAAATTNSNSLDVVNMTEELIALEKLAEGDIAPPVDTTVVEEEAPKDTADTTVTRGKSPGRPKKTKTPEQQAIDDAYRAQRQDIGRNAINDITKAEKTLAQEVDEAAILERSANEKEAQDALFSLREQRIGALETAYRLSVDPDQKKKTAGTRATALLTKADPQELEVAKQRYETKQKIGAPSRAEITESTNGQDNPVFETLKYKNDARSVLSWIANNGNPFERMLAARLRRFLGGAKFVIVDSADDMPTAFLRDKMTGAAGLYVPARNTIYVMRKGGTNNTVILHEALHAATVKQIDTYLELKEAGKPIPNFLRVPVRELMETMDAAKQNYDLLKEQALLSDNLGLLTQDMLDIPEDAFTDIKEFVAYGLSLPAMQEFLLLSPGEYAGVPPGFINKLFNRFVQGIRKLFNMDETHSSALQDLIIVTNKLLAAPMYKLETEPLSGRVYAAKAKKQPAPPKAPKPPKQLKLVESLLRKIRLSNRSSELNGSIGELIMQVRNASDAIRLMKAIYSAIDVNKLRLVLRTFTTEDITRIAGDRINNLKVINSAVDDMAGMRVKMIRELAEKTPAWINFNEKYEEGGRIIGDLINASTLLEVDPTKHPDAATAIKNDPKLQRIENDILNPSTDPKTLPNLKKQRTERTAAIKLVYEGGAFNNPVTGEKYTMGGWEQLGKIGKGEGQAIYAMAKDSYKKTFDMHEQLLKEKIAASNVPGDINDASTPKGKLIAAITKTFQEAKLLEVYFPLMRYGNFWFSVGKGKSGEFYMFEGEVARNNAIEARVAELNKAGDKRTKDQMIADGDIDVGNDIRKLREKHIESSDMLKEIFAMLDQNKMSDIDAVKDNIYQMYLMTLPDKDIRRKFVHRQGKTGFSADAIRNFIVSQHTAANQLARLKYSDKIRNGIAAAYAEIQQNPDKLKLATIIREVSNRAINEITPTVPEEGLDWDQVASIGNKFVFYWLLTSPKSALVQMTQLPIVGLPTLGAEFGIGKATATAARYGALWNKFGTTKKDANGNVVTEWGQPSINDSSYVNKHPNLAYRKVLKDAWNFANDKDIFMSTYAGDMTAMSAVPTARYQGVVSRGTRFVFDLMGGAFHHAERISREIMFMSSFELAYADYKGKGLDDKAAFDAATEKALKLTYDALFNYTQYNKPPPMKSAAGRLAFQFLTYPLQMTSYLIRNFYGMLPFLNKEEKKEAAIKFFGTLGMTGLFAGVTGFPLYSLIMGMTDGMRELLRDDEDEDYDEDDEGNPLGRRSTDLWFRNWLIPNYFGPDSSLASFFNLTEEQAAKLARGVEMGLISSYTDLNVGGSTSLDGLWFRSDTPAETSREAFQNFVFSFTGPIGSVGANFAGAFDDFNRGDINRGFEKLSPAWMKGGLTAIRLKSEGATTTKGDEIMNPEFYTTGKLLAQTLGFGSTEVAQVQKANFMAKKIVTEINREKATLLNRLDAAVRRDDDDEIDEMLEKIDKFNTKNAMLAINGRTISKSLQSRAERRGKAYQGLSVSDKEAPFVYPLVEGTRSPEYKK
jgi:hypothetical protein